MNNLAKIRGKHQITLTDLARQIGVTKQALSLNEKGHLNIRIAKKAAEILGENVFEILGADVLTALPENEQDKAIIIKTIQEL